MTRLERVLKRTIIDDDWGTFIVDPGYESITFRQGEDVVRIDKCNIPQLIRAIKKADSLIMQKEVKKIKGEDCGPNPDWKGDPNDTQRWQGW